jgi:putative transposase
MPSVWAIGSIPQRSSPLRRRPDPSDGDQRSRLAADLDAKVAEFRERPLDNGPYRYLWIDAITQKVREGGRVVNVSAVIATAVNAEGRREIIGFDIVTTESTPAWTAFLRSLVARGLTGVELVISDAHGGIKAAIAAVLGGASWQRCRTHFRANLATRVPKSNWPMIATLVRSIFEQPDCDTTWAQLGDVVSRLTEAGFVAIAEELLEAADDILAFSAFPVERWPQIRSNNPQERLNKEIRRRTDVVGIFPNRAAIVRLVGALLAEQTDEWAVARRYVSAEALTKPRLTDHPSTDPRRAVGAITTTSECPTAHFDEQRHIDTRHQTELHLPAELTQQLTG